MSPLDESEQTRELVDEQAVANGFGPRGVAKVTVSPLLFLTSWTERRELATTVASELLLPPLRVEATWRSDDICTQRDIWSALGGVWPLYLHAEPAGVKPYSPDG